MDDKKFLTFKQARKMLPKKYFLIKRKIHTFRQRGNFLIGADWDKKALLKIIKQYQVEETGSEAQKMNHGMALYDEVGILFIETKRKMQIKI